MKKIVIGFFVCILLVLSIFVTVHAFNFQLFDTKWNFVYAQIAMPDGSVIKGHVDSWRDFEDGDQLQVMINGTTYLTHASNVVLMDKE